MERTEALADFDTALAEWATAFAQVPDAALTYLKPGDDYALGGLQVHVNWVLEHYHRILDAIMAADFGAVGPQDPAGAEEAARRNARQGLIAQERQPALDAMQGHHADVRHKVSGLDGAEWGRKAPVVYGEGQDPYPTSPEDIVGWLADHYREHVGQCGDLVAEWETATPR